MPNEQMVHSIYPTEHKLNKANASNSEAAFLDLNISIKNEAVSQKIYVDFDFDIADFPFLDGDVPRSPSNGVYIFEPRHEKTNVLHMRKQRLRSASRVPRS